MRRIISDRLFWQGDMLTIASNALGTLGSPAPPSRSRRRSWSEPQMSDQDLYKPLKQGLLLLWAFATGILVASFVPLHEAIKPDDFIISQPPTVCVPEKENETEKPFPGILL